MEYIIPKIDQINTKFLFTISEHVHREGHIVPFQLILSKNLDELNAVPLGNLRRIATKLRIPGRNRMNKNVLSTHIRQYIIFE